MFCPPNEKTTLTESTPVVHSFPYSTYVRGAAVTRDLWGTLPRTGSVGLHGIPSMSPVSGTKCPLWWVHTFSS